MEIKGKRISIIGAAKSGLAAAKTLGEAGASIFVSDMLNADKLKAALINSGLIEKVEYEAGGNTERVLDADLIILSPGVKRDIPLLLEADKRGIPVWGDTEASYRFSKGRRFCITGSNGKTTTTTLLSLMCQKHFPKVFLGGNIGIPVMSFAAETTDDSVQVLEISSFQLESAVKFRPDIAIITNFFENHLDRYPNYKAYIDAKKRIFMNMGSQDWLILNADQPLMHEAAKEAKCRIAWFGHNVSGLKPSITTEEGSYVYTDQQGSKKILFPMSAAKLVGTHNSENIMCAALAGILGGVPLKDIESTVREFSGVEHRLEYVKTLDGIDYINDSKGTNCAASIIAMRATKKPLILIAGGKDKGTDLGDWVKAVRKYCKCVVLYGEAKNRFRSALEGLVPIKAASGFEDALMQAKDSAVEGDTVLLSPACSSYDLFPCFEARGARFKELVHNLKGKSGNQ